MESETTTVTNQQSVECETVKTETNLKNTVVSCEVEENSEKQLAVEEQIQENNMTASIEIAEETKSEESIVNENIEEKKMTDEEKCVTVNAGLTVEKENEIQEEIAMEESQDNIEKKDVVQEDEVPQQRVLVQNLDITELNDDLKKQEAEPETIFDEEHKSIETKDVVQENVEEILTEEILATNRMEDANEEALEDINQQTSEEVVINEQEIQQEENLEIDQHSNYVVTEQEDRLHENIVIEEIHKVEECAGDEVQEPIIEENRIIVCEDYRKEPVILALIEKGEEIDTTFAEQEKQVEVENQSQTSEDIIRQTKEEVVIDEQEIQQKETLEIEQNFNVIVTEQEDSLQEHIVIKETNNVEECAEDEVQEICVEDQTSIEVKSDLIVVPETNQVEQQNEQDEMSLPPFVIKVLDEIAISEGFLPGYKYELLPGSNHGDGFVAIMVRVIISGKKNKNFKIIHDKLKLICKVPPTNEVIRKQFGSMQLFEREVFMYNIILPYFVKFQLEKGIKPDEGFFSFSKCYYACYDETKDESVVILEDLLERGFQLPNKFKPVSYVEIRKLMISLGRLHAISLALKEQQPEQFDKFKVKDTSEMFTTDKLQPMFEALCDKAMDTLEEHEEFKREKIEKLKPNISKVMYSCIQNDEDEPYAVVNHGDCWINNIMFTQKLGSLQGDICMIDWQLSRYCSPVLDLVYFIFTCTDAETRLQHYDNCIQIYHKALSTFLERLGGDASRQLPLSALYNQLKKYGKFGVCASILMTHMLCAEKSDIPDIETITKNMENIGKNDTMYVTSDKYKIRMSSVIRDAIRLGYL